MGKESKRFENHEEVMVDLFGEDNPIPDVEEKSSSEEIPTEESKAEGTANEEQKKEEQKEEESEESKEKSIEGEKSKSEEDLNFLNVLRIDSVPESKEEVEALLKKTAKVVTDNRTNFNKEHDALLATQKEVESVKKQLEELQAAKQERDKDLEEAKKAQAKLAQENLDKEFEEGSEDAVKKYIKSLQDQITRLEEGTALTEEELNKAVRREVIAAQEKTFKASHPDYDEVMNDFIPVLENDEAKLKEWTAAGSTPEKAYEMAKKYQEVQQILKDPEAFRKSIEEEVTKKLQSGTTESKTPAKTLSNVASKGGTQAKSGKYTSQDQVMEELFPVS